MRNPHALVFEAFGILSPYGGVWTRDVFETEASARQHIAAFWAKTPKLDQSEFRVVPVCVTINPLPSPPTGEE